MKASIILTNYNFCNYIADAIDSVLTQTYPNFELLIIDDGSTDNSRDVINKYISNPKVKALFKENGGQLSCLNLSMEYISGDIIFLLDSDDMYLPEYIANTIELYTDNPFYDIISCQHINTDASGRELPYSKSFVKREGYTLLASYYLQDYIGNITSTISIKSKIFKRIMPLDIENDWSITSIDTILHYSVALAGGKAFYSNQYLVHRKIHGNNITLKWQKGEALTSSYRHKAHFQVIRLFNYVMKKFDGNIKSFDFLFAREILSRRPKSLRLIIRYLYILLLMDQSITFKISMFFLLIRVSYADKND